MPRVAAFAEATDRLLETLNSPKHLRSAVEQLDVVYHKVVPLAGMPATMTGNRLNEAIASLQAELSVGVELIREIDSSDLFGDLREVRRELDRPEPYGHALSPATQDLLIDAIDELIKSLNEFMRNQVRDRAMSVISAGHDLEVLLLSVTEMALTFRTMFHSNADVPEDERLVRLVFDAIPTAHLVEWQLNQLQAMYDVAGALFAADQPIRPLWVRRIEEGSEFLEIAGSVPVMGVLAWAFSSAARLGFRRFTRAGRLGALRQERTELSDWISLEQEMRTRGYDSSATREAIQATADRLSEKAEDILSGNSMFMLDGQEFVRARLTELPHRLPGGVRQLGPGDTDGSTEP